MSTSTDSSSAAEATVRNLSTRFPGRVQIHLHPSTSLPPALTLDLAESTSLPDLASTSVLPVALVWTVDSLKLLRKYGLTGSFSGTLAQFPQQNIFLGLPIQLLPEEVVFLLRRGLAVVVDEANSYRSSTVEDIKAVNEGVEEQRRSQQLEAWHERQVLRLKHAKNAEVQTEAKPTEKDLEVLPWHYTIASTSTALAWYVPRTYTKLSEVQPVFCFPSTEKECASVGLFEHLKAQDHWLMNGLRFGGNFAVYPGDPLRYHSHYTAQLVLPDDNLSLTSLVANGRLGTAVKKTHLLCHVTAFDPQLGLKQRCQTESTETDEQKKPLQSIAQGLFDVAPKAEPRKDEQDEDANSEGQAKEFASYNIFSLAWAGFGT